MLLYRYAWKLNVFVSLKCYAVEGWGMRLSFVYNTRILECAAVPVASNASSSAYTSPPTKGIFRTSTA